MTNWSMNTLECDADVLLAVTAREHVDDGEKVDGFCLNKIIACPDTFAEIKNPVLSDIVRIHVFGLMAGNGRTAEQMLDMLKVDNPTLTAEELEPKDRLEWRLINWDTKWDIDAVSLEECRVCYISFDTVWGPPENAIQTLSGQFPECEMKLSSEESEMYIAGHTVFRAGKVHERVRVDPADYALNYQNKDLEEVLERYQVDENTVLQHVGKPFTSILTLGDCDVGDVRTWCNDNLQDEYRVHWCEAGSVVFALFADGADSCACTLRWA